MTDISRESVEDIINLKTPITKTEIGDLLRALRDALDERLNFEEALKDDNERLRRALAEEKDNNMFLEAALDGTAPEMEAAHRAGWDDAIEAAVHIVLAHTPSVPLGGPANDTAKFVDALMDEVHTAIRALPYKPQEDVSDG